LRVLITAAFGKEGMRILEKYMEIVYEPWLKTRRVLSDNDFIRRIREENFDAIIVEVDFVGKRVFESCDLKFVGVCRNEVRNVAVDAATKKGVPVFYTPGRNADAVADLTIGLIIALLRKICLADRMLRVEKVVVGGFDDFLDTYERLRGFELGGKTVGIVGFGRIGYRVAKRLVPFGTRILVYDPYVGDGDERLREVGAKKVDFETLLRESDIVTVHCAVTPETLYMFKEEQFRRMKRTAYFINMASGAVVKEDALIKALREGWIAGAAVDVSAREPIDSRNPLLEFDNVIVTPHIGGSTHEVIDRQAKILAEDIERFIRGERPKFVVNPEVLEKGQA